MAYIKDDNGDYKRTVRCGYCSQIGHNKSACSKRKEDLTNQVKTYQEQLKRDDLDEWDRSYKTKYLQRSQEDLNKMLNRGKNRKCGYCGSEGHTRRTCSDRKTDLDVQTRKTINLRKKAAENMVAAGFGPGALIETECYPSEFPVLAIITEICMSEVFPRSEVRTDDYFIPSDAARVRYVTPIKHPWDNGLLEYGKAKIPLAFMNVENHNKSEWYNAPDVKVKVVSPVEISIKQILSTECVNDKTVRKVVLEEIVDPR
mgnify:CR=1 FL=1